MCVALVEDLWSMTPILEDAMPSSSGLSGLCIHMVHKHT